MQPPKIKATYVGPPVDAGAVGDEPDQSIVLPQNSTGAALTDPSLPPWQRAANEVVIYQRFPERRVNAGAPGGGSALDYHGPARTAEIMRLKGEGRSNADIGRLFSITSKRVANIYAERPKTPTS